MFVAAGWCTGWNTPAGRSICPSSTASSAPRRTVQRTAPQLPSQHRSGRLNSQAESLFVDDHVVALLERCAKQSAATPWQHWRTAIIDSSGVPARIGRRDTCARFRQAC
jgi:hypothetical protein